MTSMPANRAPRFEDVGEAFSASEITTIALAALLFVTLMRSLNPITNTTFQEIFTPERLEKNFVPGFFQGSVLAAGMVLAFLLSGAYRYLGFFIQFEEAPLALTSVILRIIALLVFVYCEEFIFRVKLLGFLREIRPDTQKPFLQDLTAAVLCSLVFVGIKILQFDLGIMHKATLFLVSMALCMRALCHKDFAQGAGFWAAILVVFHPLLSLPVLGSDFAGLLLVKYQSLTPDGQDMQSTTARFFTGGAGGPISSFAIQILLLIDVIKGSIQYKKTLSNLPSPKLR